MAQFCNETRGRRRRWESMSNNIVCMYMMVWHGFNLPLSLKKVKSWEGRWRRPRRRRRKVFRFPSSSSSYLDFFSPKESFFFFFFTVLVVWFLLRFLLHWFFMAREWLHHHHHPIVFLSWYMAVDKRSSQQHVCVCVKRSGPREEEEGAAS